jgi:MOSC domain-containing protein YiiM
MGHIKHIFIATGRGEPMTSVAEAEALANCGLRGDRYAESKNRKSASYEITLIEIENILAFVDTHGLSLSADQPRRNLVTSGVNLNDLNEQRFSVGNVELEGIELCEPCAIFAKRTYPEVVPFFVHKGGLRARIVNSGIIRVGDAVETRTQSSVRADAS